MIQTIYQTKPYQKFNHPLASLYEGETITNWLGSRNKNTQVAHHTILYQEKIQLSVTPISNNSQWYMY